MEGVCAMLLVYFVTALCLQLVILCLSPLLGVGLLIMGLLLTHCHDVTHLLTIMTSGSFEVAA